MATADDWIIKAYESGELTDVKITCGGKEIKGHSIFIYGASDVFKSMVSSGFKESTTGVIDLPEDNYSLVKRMIDALYYGNYNHQLSEEEKTQFGTHGFELHAEMYAVAEKYQIEKVKVIARDNYKRCSTAGLEALKSFLRSIPIVFENTPAHDQDIRHIILRRMVGNTSSFISAQTLEEFREATVASPAFNWDLHLYSFSKISTLEEENAAATKRALEHAEEEQQASKKGRTFKDGKPSMGRTR